MEGSDTWRYSQTGARLIVGRGLKDTVYHWHQSQKLLEILGRITSDILIVEGFKDERMPRIVCAAETAQLAKLVDTNTYCISGAISEELHEFRGIPVYNVHRDLPKIIALAEQKSTRVE